MGHTRASVVLVAGALALAGCVRVDSVFQCEDTAACVQGGVPGRCEANGFCSFPDPTCASGSRYGKLAPDDVAARCTDETSGTDAGGGTADGIDAAPSRCGGTSLLADDFEDGVRSTALWGQSFDNGSPPLLAETGGRVVLTYAEESGSTYAEYRSTRRYDLRDDHVRLEVSTTPAPDTAAQVELGVMLDDDRRIDVVLEEGNLLFLYHSGGFVNVDSKVLAAADRWWQIRESGGMIYYGTSPDGVDFTDHAMVAAPFDVSAVTVLFGGGTYELELNAGTAAFDDFNGGTPSGAECP